MSEPASAKILCVDDDAQLLAAIVRALRRDPLLDVRSTTDPIQALAWIAREDIAVLIADYEMPQMTGAELAGKARRARPETVRLLLTGKRTLETAIDGIHQGEIFRFINKPFELAALRQAVADGVKRHEELVALSGDRQRRARAAALQADLEAEYPGITAVERDGDTLVVTEDPWRDAEELGLVGLDRKLER